MNRLLFLVAFVRCCPVGSSQRVPLPLGVTIHLLPEVTVRRHRLHRHQEGIGLPRRLPVDLQTIDLLQDMA